MISLIAASSRTATILLAPDGAKFRLPHPVGWRLEDARGAVVRDGVHETATLFIEDLAPATDYTLRTDLGDLSIVTRPCAGLVAAEDFGADPDAPDNTQALADAVAAVPEAGCLRIGPGRHVSGPIFLKPRMTLWLPEGAELAARGDRNGWPILPARDGDGRLVGSWEGVPARSYAALVTGLFCDGVTLTGRGIIDGGGDRGDWWDWPKETREGARRARTVYLAACPDTQITGLTIRNSPSWTVHPIRCDRLTAAALTIRNPHDSPNTDGFDPESCRSVRLVGLDISGGDDCIAVKAGKRVPDGTDHMVATRDLSVTHCRMERGHGAVVIGSEMSGDITDVTVARCEFIGTDRGLRIKTRRGRGGRIARISLDDVAMDGVSAPVTVNAFYFCDPDGRSDAVQSRTPAPVDETTPEVTDIAIRGVRATGAELAGVAVLGLPEAPVSNVSISDMTVTFSETARPDCPLMALGVPAMRHVDLYAENAEVVGRPVILSNESTRAHAERVF